MCESEGAGNMDNYFEAVSRFFGLENHLLHEEI